jgi:UDP-2-acetamido-3-amino-2,3-dideoxy-glucuronate N-acetyltransferase
MSNVVVVGCGYWGKNLVRNFSELGALGGVCDIDAARREENRKKYAGAAIYGDLGEVLEDPKAPAVAVATPAATHYDVVKAALLAGKDVFVEKPIALTYREGAELVALAAERKKILMVGHILEYHPAVDKLKEIVRSGDLGKIYYIYSNRLNLGKIRKEENILWSFAPHDISVILYLLDEMPVEVQAYGGSYLSPGITDVTVTAMRFPSGTRAHIFVSWLHPYKEQKLVLVGEKKMLLFDDVSPKDKILAYDHKIDWVDGLPVPRPEEAQRIACGDGEPLKAECRHFLECLATRERPRTDGRKGLKVLRILEAAQESLKSKGKEISVMEEKGERAGRGAGSGGPMDFFVHPLAVVDDNVEIGEGTKIWHFSHVQSGARIGKRCVLGQNVNVGNNVAIGNFVKIQNNVSVYEGVTLEDHVFCGPSMVFTNINDPRSKYPQVGAKFYKKTLVREGASLGANSTIICGHTIGRYAFVGGGAVVTKDIPDFALVVGNPARLVGWMSEAGVKLVFDAAGYAFCEKSKKRYRLANGFVSESG